MTFIVKLLSYLPISILYLLSDFISFTSWHIFQYRKKVVLSNISRCFPDKSHQEIRQIARRFYDNLSDIIVETIMTIRADKSFFQKRIVFNNQHTIKKHLEEGRVVFCMCGHQCNWEWFLHGFSAHFDYPADAIYKKLTNKSMDDMIFKIRSQFGGYPVEKKNAVKEIIKRSKEGPRVYGMVSDQLPRKREEKYWTQFFDQETAFFTGSDFLAKITKGAAVFLTMKRLKRGHYQIDTYELAEPPYDQENMFEIIESYARKLEQSIREQPSDWLWSHKRWKYTREQVES